MKLKCVNTDKNPLNLLLNRSYAKELTIGKVYTVLQTISSRNENSFTEFLVFNDNNEWKDYPIRLFAPVEDL